jgi:hypothetical protein
MTTPVQTMPPDHSHTGPCTPLQILQRDVEAMQRQREEDREALEKQRKEDQERATKEREHMSNNIRLLFEKIDGLKFWIMVTGISASGALLVILIQVIMSLATKTPAH